MAEEKKTELKDSYNYCPYCGATNIEIIDFDNNGNNIYHCHVCSMSFVELEFIGD